MFLYYLQMASAQLNHSMMADKEQCKKKESSFCHFILKYVSYIKGIIIPSYKHIGVFTILGHHK